MHEASLMKNLMGKLEQLAREHGAGRVTRVSVKLGALSHFSPDHFREQRLPMDIRDGEIQLRGVIGLPELANPTAKYQFFYLNGRSIRDRHWPGVEGAARQPGGCPRPRTSRDAPPVQRFAWYATAAPRPAPRSARRMTGASRRLLPVRAPGRAR